jgi:hypothetical protein
MKFFCLVEGMLTRFCLWVCQVLGKCLSLAMANCGNLGIGLASGHMVSAIPDFIIRRLCVSDQV